MDEADKEIIDLMRKRRAAAAQDYDADSAPAYRSGNAGGTYYAPTHEESVRKRLGWIVGGVWVIAGAVIANFIAAIVIGAAAAASSNPF